MTAISNSALGVLFSSGLFVTESKFQELFDSHINRLGDSMIGVLEVISGSAGDPGIQFAPLSSSAIFATPSATIPPVAGIFRRSAGFTGSILQATIAFRSDNVFASDADPTKARFPLLLGPFGVSIGGSVTAAADATVNVVPLILSARVQAASGTAAAPAYTFNQEIDTGFFFDGPGTALGGSNSNVAVTLIGTEVARFTSGSAFPTPQFTPATDTGTNLGSSTLQWNEVFASQYLAADGTAAEPAYTFLSEADTGAYLSSAGHYSVAIGGAQVMTVSAGGVSLSSQFSTPAGTAGAPAYTFNADDTTGMYLSGSATLGFSVSGVDILTLASGMLDAQSNRIIMVADGVNPNDVVNKFQLDSVAAGLNPKDSCEVATTSILASVGNGVWSASGSGVGKQLTAAASGITTIDAIVLSDLDRVLVKDEDGSGTGSNLSAADNGIYFVVANTASAGAPTVLERTTDFDGTPGNEVGGGDFTFIISGSALAGTGWTVVGGSDINVDIDDINFTQFSGAGAVSLEGLSDTTITGVVTNDTLIFNAGSWENRTPTEARVHHNTGENHIDGSAEAPAVAFANNLDTGMFLASTGIVALAASGVKVAEFDSEGGGQILMPDGTLTDPSYTFSSETDTGMFLVSALTLAFAVDGSTMLRIQSTSGISPTTRINAIDGSVGFPGYSFQGDTDTGIHLPTTGVMTFGVSSGSNFSMTAVANIAKRELQIPDGSADNPSLSFEANTNTGLFRPGGNELGFAAGASMMFKIDQGSSVTVIAPLVITGSNAQVLAIDGSAGAPAYSFESAPNTGMHLGVTAGRLDLVASGTTMIQMIADDAIFVFGHLGGVTGSAAEPSFRFNNDQDTGMFLAATGRIGFSVAGSSMVQFDRIAGATFHMDVLPDGNLTRDLGSSTLQWNRVHASTFDGVSTTAVFGDLAERYEADKEYDVGTVVIVGGAKEITESRSVGDDRVLGVISGNPAFAMNKNAGPDKTHPYVGLSGRVPCKVKGPIYKGQRLVSSSAVGHAEGKSHPNAGTTIGLALEDFPDSAKGVIEVTIKRC